MIPRLTASEAEGRIRSVRGAKGTDRGHFTRLAELAGLNPAEDLRFGNFSGVNFSGCDLDGYDFTGASLVGCSFVDARISGARFQQTEFSFPGDSMSCDLSSALDWEEACSKARETHPEFPLSFDEHIQVGAYFRDDTCAPLMKCVLAKCPDGIGRKYAIAMSSVNVMFNDDGSNRKRDYVASMNQRLGFGNHFGYQRTSDKRFLVRGKEPRNLNPSLEIEVDNKSGLMFVKRSDDFVLPTSVEFDEHSGMKSINHPEDEVRGSTERIRDVFRRMRMPGCDLERGHYVRRPSRISDTVPYPEGRKNR